MSAFLGAIHNWLFEKIKFQNELTEEIVRGMTADEKQNLLLEQMDRRYGALEKGELQDIIDESNIHGWLQERITCVENRLAFAVTLLTDDYPEHIGKIKIIAYEFGKKHALSKGISVKEAHDYLENVLLNGMPCDRVNQIVENSEDKITWTQTTDIHQKYWDVMSGNIENYYEIRCSLIDGILEESNLIFTREDNNVFTIRKE